MGFFVPDEEPVIWRGPMLHKALEQFLVDAYWGEPDFLLVDMPPGTGDVALSLAEFLPRTEVVVVTTPQAAAQRVAQRSAYAARKLKLSVRGVVENLSWFTGDDGTRYELFGRGGGEALAADLDVPLLGRIPLVPAIREGADVGEPVHLRDPDGEAARAFDALARPASRNWARPASTGASSTSAEPVPPPRAGGLRPSPARTRPPPWRNGRSCPPRRPRAPNTARSLPPARPSPRRASGMRLGRSAKCATEGPQHAHHRRPLGHRRRAQVDVVVIAATEGGQGVGHVFVHAHHAGVDDGRTMASMKVRSWRERLSPQRARTTPGSSAGVTMPADTASSQSWHT